MILEALTGVPEASVALGIMIRLTELLIYVVEECKKQTIYLI